MAVRDKIAGKVVADRDKTARAEAIHDKIAEEAADDNTIDPSIELAVPEAVDRVGEEANEIIVIDSITETIIDKIAEEVAEFLVEQPIEAIQAAERIDKEAEGPKFESKLHLWPTPRNLTPKNSTRLDLKPENFRIKAAAKHSIVFRPGNFSN